MIEKPSKRTRKRHRAEFKARVVTSALREDQILNQLSTRFGVHPVMIGDWKKQALLALPGLFGQKLERDAEAVAARERELYDQIGRLEMENAGLKKSSALSPEARRAMIDRQHTLSVRQQCRLLGLDRSGFMTRRSRRRPRRSRCVIGWTNSTRRIRITASAG